MKKLTIAIDESLMVKLKMYAVRNGKSIKLVVSSLIEDLVVEPVVEKPSVDLEDADVEIQW